MATAKDIVLKQIDSKTANEFVRKVHYSGKVAQNSQLHLGVFLDGVLHGAMQFGPSLDKRKIQGLVKDTKWHEFLELNRMAFDDVLPRNSESRALSIAFRLLKKHAPQVKWIVSFADGTQCGDGTIYRAAGFVLTGIKENEALYELPDGTRVHDLDFEVNRPTDIMRKVRGELNEPTLGRKRLMKKLGAEKLQGFQLRYIYFLDPAYRARLTVPELPFSEIEKRGAKMYKGQKPGGEGETDNAPGTNPETEGASPISPL